MKFSEHLTYFRERKKLTKTGLAEKIGVTPTTVMEWESGRKKPPAKHRIEEISSILSLSSLERQRLIDSAMEERLSQEALEWLHEKENRQKKIEEEHLRDIIKTLINPKAHIVRAGLSEKEIMSFVNNVINSLSGMSTESKKEF